ncbi:beta-phosphoglucomutase family hydrolase [Actinomadura macra]|uniref:beta-phosphoglucomutase family hydrolase n=1 Tax=Actinomadura macra TaxID=46164 RepID=UPI0008370089|nr:beta-phosphoglucomutase family hydrolase [Actinomadura macra]
MLGLPDETQACLFDLDGVLTDTAAVHAAAWKEMFDGFLRDRAERTGEAFVPFDPVKDYGGYVDGKKREDGTRSFLRARGIDLPEGTPDDPPENETVRGLGSRKNALVLKFIQEKGVKVFDGSVEYVRRVREAGLRTAVVSSSANTVQVLETVGITDLFDARVDGVVAAQRKIPGKPAPDMFLAGAREVGVPAARAVVFEDALAGVEAGRAGGFALVVGVNRVGEEHAAALAAHGADVVVADLSELLEGK